MGAPECVPQTKGSMSISGVNTPETMLPNSGPVNIRSPRSRLLGQLRSPSAEAKFSPKNPTQDLRQQGSTDTSVKGCHPVGISVTPKIGNSHSACGTRFTIRLLDVRSQR